MILFTLPCPRHSYSLHDRFVIQPKDSAEEMIISRINGDVTVQSEYKHCARVPQLGALHLSQLLKNAVYNYTLSLALIACARIGSWPADISNQFNDSRNLRKVCGILGTIKLIDVKYLAVATHREFVGVIDNQVIWRLAGHDLIPFTSTALSLTETQVRKVGTRDFGDFSIKNGECFPPL